jgi:hypothetical protein
MKGCLDHNRLLAMMLAEPGEDLVGRAHLARCTACSALYRELVADTSLIARTLDSTARAVMAAPQRSPGLVHVMADYRKPRTQRTFVTIAGAAFAGAIAATYILMLPATHSIGSRSIVTAMATRIAPPAQGGSSSAAGEITTASPAAPYVLWQPYQSDVLITDPAEDIRYHEALAGTSSYQDLFFCVPQDDGTFCTSSADQG